MKMEILLESTSNKLMVGIREVLLMLEILSRRFFLKLNLSDHRYEDKYFCGCSEKVSSLGVPNANNNRGPENTNTEIPESSFARSHVFKKGDDPIDAINHMMSFLSAVVTSRYPTTNNQLRNSSNPRQHATINDGRVTLQPVKGRQISFAIGTSRTYTPETSGSNSGLHEEELAFLADPRIAEDALAEVHNPDNEDNNMINQGVQVILFSKQSNVVNHSETKITSDSNIIPYSKYVTESQQAVVQNSNSSTQQDALILSVIEQLKTQVINCTKINLNNKSVNDTLTDELERYKEQVKVLKEGQNVETLISLKKPTKVDVPKELPKVSMVNMSLKKLKHHLAGFDVVVKERTMTTTIIEGSWGFEHTKSCFRDEIVLFVKALKDIFNTFDQYLIDEHTEIQNVFHQMEQAVKQHRLESKHLKLK
nr:hypothetical protein [Tanacetum cinerariifolium]